MKKYLLTFEFRYMSVSIYQNTELAVHTTKTTTIGVFETLEEAVKIGNDCLSDLSKTFNFRGKQFKVKGLLGYPDTLVTNTCYSDKVEFFGKITTLSYNSITDIVNETLEARKQYENWKKKTNNK